MVGRARLVWQAGAIVGVLALVITAPSHVGRLRDFRHDIVTYRASWDRFHDVVTGPIPCLPFTFANHRPFPMVVFWTDIEPHQLRESVDGTPPAGSYLWGTRAAMHRRHPTRQRSRSSRAAAAGYPGRSTAERLDASRAVLLAWIPCAMGWTPDAQADGGETGSSCSRSRPEDGRSSGASPPPPVCSQRPGLPAPRCGRRPGSA